MILNAILFFSALAAAQDGAIQHSARDKMILNQHTFDFAKEMVAPPYESSVLSGINLNLSKGSKPKDCPTNGPDPLQALTVANVGTYCSLSGETPRLELAHQSLNLKFWHTKGNQYDHFKIINTHVTLDDPATGKNRLIDKVSLSSDKKSEIDLLCKAMGYGSGRIVTESYKSVGKSLKFNAEEVLIEDVTDGDDGASLLGKEEVNLLSRPVMAVSAFECKRLPISEHLKRMLKGDLFHSDINSDGNTSKRLFKKKTPLKSAKEAIEKLPRILRTKENIQNIEQELE